MPELGDAVDKEFTLHELLNSVGVNRLQSALQGLLGTAVRIVDLRGAVLLGSDTEGPSLQRVPLHSDIEPIGYLEADVDETRMAAVKGLLELLLRSNLRYLMASAMHNEVINEDYAVLQRKHEALQRSEERYRALSESLEQRVQDQVKTIELAQRQLYQSEKLASVGQLAAGLAHEINNPIGFISSNLRTAQSYIERLKGFGARINNGSDVTLLQRSWGGENMDFMLSDFAALLDESQSGAAKVARIVADLKDFTRLDHFSEELDSINHIITKVIAVARSQIPQNIRVEFHAGEIPAIRCYPGQLGQVFYNMLQNACQSIDGEGSIRFTTDLQGPYIRIRIEDNGAGIPVEIQDRIFEPFFTTREVGQGTGLGLTVCNDIVRAHGGRIELDSQLGKGTIFSLYLPVTVPSQ